MQPRRQMKATVPARVNPGMRARLFQSDKQKNGGEIEVFDLLNEAKPRGILGSSVRDEYLKHPDRIPADWHGKVILFADEGEVDDGMPTVPALILWSITPRRGCEYQKKKVGTGYAVAIH